MMDFNALFWGVGNLLVLLIFVSATTFSILYPLLFDFTKTTGGKAVWRVILSIAGYGVLAILTIMINGWQEWWSPPTDTPFWWPAVRALIYGLIAYSFASLVVLLLVRRFRPEWVKTRPLDEDTLSIKPRHHR